MMLIWPLSLVDPVEVKTRHLLDMFHAAAQVRALAASVHVS